MNTSKRSIVQDLAVRIQQIETGRRPHWVDGTGAHLEGLGGLLPQDGLARGAFVELLAAMDGSGTWTLGTVMAARVCPKQKLLVIVDADRQFYFPGAIRLGLDSNRSIVLRPAGRRDAYQAMVQSLRSSAVGAVLSWQERLSIGQLRRLQLAAESGGGRAILLRPSSALRDPSCAPVRLVVSPVAHSQAELFFGPSRLCGAKTRRHLSLGSFPGRPWTRYVRVEVMRCRGRAHGESFILEIDDETGHVHPPAAMASAKAVARSARASG